MAEGGVLTTDRKTTLKMSTAYRYGVACSSQSASLSAEAAPARTGRRANEDAIFSDKTGERRIAKHRGNQSAVKAYMPDAKVGSAGTQVGKKSTDSRGGDRRCHS